MKPLREFPSKALRSIRIAEESGDAFSKGSSYIAYGISCSQKGFFEKSIEYLAKGAAHCERIHYLSNNDLAEQYLAESCFELRKYQESIHHYEKAIRIFEKINTFRFWHILCKIGAARARVLNKEKNIDLELLYGYAHETKYRQIQGWLRRYIGQILLNVPDQNISEGKGWIEEAIDADKKNVMMFQLGQDCALYAELFKRKGDQSKAKENMNKAIDIYKECGADGWVEKAENELALIS